MCTRIYIRLSFCVIYIYFYFLFSNMMIVTNKRDYKFNEVKDALNRGADVNKTDDDGNTPLHIATMSDSYKTVQLLIDRGAKRKYNSLSLSLSLLL